MLVRTLRALLAGADRRLARAEARFYDAYGRGGPRRPRDLVIPLGYFGRARVRALLRAWLDGVGPLDADALLAEWHAALPDEARRDERLFFKNLADFVAAVHAAPRPGAPAPPALHPWALGRRRA